MNQDNDLNALTDDSEFLKQSPADDEPEDEAEAKPQTTEPPREPPPTPMAAEDGQAPEPAEAEVVDHDAQQEAEAIRRFEAFERHLKTEMERGGRILPCWEDVEAASEQAGISPAGPEVTAFIQQLLTSNAPIDRLLDAIKMSAGTLILSDQADAQRREEEANAREHETLAAMTVEIGGFLDAVGSGELSASEGREAIENLTKQMTDLVAGSQHEIDLMRQPVRYAEVRRRIQNLPPQVETDFHLYHPDNDEVVPLGFERGALNFVAGTTGGGKTQIQVSLAVDMARKYPDTTAWYLSYEESEERLTIRALSAALDEEWGAANRSIIRAGIQGEGRYFRGGRETYERFLTREPEFARLMDSRALQIRYVKYSAEALCGFLRSIAIDAPTVVFIDYVQLIHMRGGRYASSADELRRVCDLLRVTAVETGLALVIGCQFNRGVQNVGQMQLANIADASHIEKNANKVFGVWSGSKRQEPGEGRRGDEGVKSWLTPNRIYLRTLKARDEAPYTWGVYEMNANTGYVNHELVPYEEITKAEEEAAKTKQAKSKAKSDKKEISMFTPHPAVADPEWNRLNGNGDPFDDEKA